MTEQHCDSTAQDSAADQCSTIKRMRVLGAPVDILSMHSLVSVIEDWIRKHDRSHWIACTNSHGVIEAHRNPEFMKVLESADLSVPDGYRLVKIARRAGYSHAEHLTAPDLMIEVCRVAAIKGYSVFFYGDTEEVLSALIANLTRQFPGLKVAGAISPPFRALSAAEERAFVEKINAARPDVLWVGLGLPKQERWLARNTPRLQVPVSVAVGATFKFHSGAVPRAPMWMVNRGLEWVWRFSHEPRRLFKRVVIYGPLFILKVAIHPPLTDTSRQPAR